MPTARVIVATYQQLPLLRVAMRGYLRQTSRDFRLVFADDGSSPETRAWIQTFAGLAREQGIDVHHVWHEDKGFRKTVILNEALRVPGDESLLLFTDGDCIPPATFVEQHLAVHAPWTVHVGGAVRLTQAVSEALSPSAIDAGRHEGLGTPADRADLRKRARKSRWGTLVRRRNRPKVLGLNMAFSRDVMEALNGFDEQYLSWGLGEDSDVRDRAMRLRPRPAVRVLYGRNDVYHLWHPRKPGQITANRAYHRTERPVRCVQGWHRGA